jgi:signal transduction histidine kinase
LGLSVVKMIVDSCGGSAWFNSEVEKGSTFSFSLPYHKTKPGGEE